MKILITGGCGFLGSNLSFDLLNNGNEVAIIDNLSRTGTPLNLKWLKETHKFEYHNFDIADQKQTWNVIRSFKPEAIFHLAGQVAMTTSIANPMADFYTNTVGTINILEGLRLFSPDTPVLYSSTNKVYGDLEQYQYAEDTLRYSCSQFSQFGFDENVGLCFSSPYGCSKGAADQYMLDYARIYGLKTVVFRHSSIFGGRQFSTFDQGWIGWFVQKSLEQKSNSNFEPFSISGNGKQVRDVLFIDDIISCYKLALKHIELTKGNAFNIGGGVNNSLSLLELFNFLENELKVKLRFTKLPCRVSDQKVFIADIRKANQLFHWKPVVSKEIGLRKMLGWVKETNKS